MTSIFRSAITDTLDHTVDPGYYSLLIFAYLAVFVSIAMVAGLSVQTYFDEHHKFDALQLGQAMGLVAGAFAVLAGAIGGFRRLDRPAVPTPGTVVTDEHKRVETTEAPKP